MLITLALLAAFAAARPQATAAPPAPSKTGAALPVMSVAVEAAPTAGAAGQQWAQDLHTALETRKDEFRSPRKGEKPELVVRIDSVAAAPKGGNVMTGALVEGTLVRPFNVTYPGEVRPQAEALSRGLRRFAEQMKNAPPPPPKK
jgi:hypothetical protein